MMFLYSCRLTWPDFDKIQSKTCTQLRNDYFQVNKSEATCPPEYHNYLCWPETLSLRNASLVCPANARRADGSYIVVERLCTDRTETRDNLTVFRRWFGPNYDDECEIPTVLHEYSHVDRDYEFHSSQGVYLWKDYEWLYTLEQYMYLLSMLCLIFALLIFWKYSRLRNMVVKMHINLFMTMLLQFSLSFAHNYFYACNVFYGKILHDGNEWGSVACKTLVTLKSYFELAKFTWLLVKGWFLYRSMTKVFDQKSLLRKYVLIGWGLPLIPIILWVIYKINTSKDYCWIDFKKKFDILSIVILSVILINICLFILNLRIVFSKIQKNQFLQRRKYYFKRAKSSLMLISFFGAYDVCYTFWPLIGDDEKKFCLLIIVQVINPTQGCIVAVLYCFINGRVREEIRRSWKNCKSQWEINIKVLKQNFRYMVHKRQAIKKDASVSNSTSPVPDFTAHI